MILAIVSAWALGADPRRLLVLVVALLWPIAIVGLVALAMWSSRRDRTPRSALFCEAVSADLRAGSPLAEALISALISVGGWTPPTSDYVPLTGLADLVAVEFADVGLELETTIAAAARSGGASADLFREIGALAIARSEVDYEVRISTAPARATAFVFLAAPTAYLIARLNSGSLSDLVASPAQRVTGLAGLGLFALGLSIAAVVLWRSQ